MDKKNILEAINKLELPLGEYYILSSGCLVMYGLRDKANDLDLCVTQDLFEILKERYDIKEESKNDCGFYKLNDLIEIVITGKYPFEYDIKDGYPVQKLTQILEWKKQANRPKDLDDIKRISEYLDKETIDRI